MRDIYSLVVDSPILSKAFKYIVLNNTSNNAPYHHLHHMMIVTKYLFEGYGYYKDVLSGDYSSILMSGMFHDMNHSMGKESDEVNVKNAIAAFKTFYEINIDMLKSEVDPDIVESMLKATQYPYVIPDSKLSLHQQLIRDCDLMVILEPDWFQNIMVGLGQEIGITDISKIVGVNKGFHENIEMRTEWAKKKYKEEWPDFLSDLTKINNLLKG
jgi:hypothetical protein